MAQKDAIKIIVFYFGHNNKYFRKVLSTFTYWLTLILDRGTCHVAEVRSLSHICCCYACWRHRVISRLRYNLWKTRKCVQIRPSDSKFPVGWESHQRGIAASTVWLRNYYEWHQRKCCDNDLFAKCHRSPYTVVETRSSSRGYSIWVLSDWWYVDGPWCWWC